MKKYISWVLVCLCLMCCVTSASAGFTFVELDTEDVFSPELIEKEDVSAWAADEVEQARAAGLLTENTSFYMTHQITRFQFAELIVNMTEKVTGEIVPAAADTFSDCDDASVLKAYAAGIVDGVGEGRFAPSDLTNREQIATMISRAISYIEKAAGKDLTPNEADLERFSDKDQVSKWAAEHVGLLAANGIMNGTSDTTLSPKNPCTVEQSVLLVLRVYKSA